MGGLQQHLVDDKPVQNYGGNEGGNQIILASNNKTRREEKD